MKIVAIGDLHGSTIWKDIIDQEKHFDHFIFIGDYFDSKNYIGADREIENFKAILDLKAKYSDKITLLIGNHDFHYFEFCPIKYSGFQRQKAGLIKNALNKALKNNQLQICKIIDNYCFTHAGLTKSWATKEQLNLDDVEKSLNFKFLNSPEVFDLQNENLDSSGNHKTASPIWVRQNALALDYLKGFTHVVGHSMQWQLMIINELIFIDSLARSKQYLVIENGNPLIKNVDAPYNSL